MSGPYLRQPVNTVWGANTVGGGVVIRAGSPVRIQTGVSNTFRRARNLGTADTVRRFVGLAQEDIADGAVGVVQLSGVLKLTTTQWDIVTGQTGGLVRAERYYLAELFGRLDMTPPVPADSVTVVNADGSFTGSRWCIEAGIAHSETEFEIVAAFGLPSAVLPSDQGGGSGGGLSFPVVYAISSLRL